MHKDSDNSAGRESPADRDSDSSKSFVKKVKSRVSGFIPTSLTKWFGGNEGPKVRHREELEEDDECYTLQPPTKRAKLPTRERSEMNFISTPLHGAHLTYSLRKDFQEPTPGPSGVKSRKLVLPNVTLQNQYSEQINLHNGDKDSDSGESTSGYSSMPRIPSKEQVSEIPDKASHRPTNITNRSLFNTTTTSERSLFSNRNTSSRLNTSLSSRRPAFNTTAFGSPNFMDRTLSTKRIIDSPFYGGRTTYGGASAYSRNMMKGTSESNSCLKNFVQAKPIESSENKHMTLSKTAKRILSTLEQYTSPSEDVRKIPNPPTRKVHRPERMSKYPGANPYSVKDSKVASNKELVVPLMSDLLKMKMKERLQDSTVSVRELATTSKSHLNTEEYKIRENKEVSTSKNTNKIKTKITSIRQKATDSEKTVEPVILPDVQLPISILPCFDFTIPSQSSNKRATEKKKLSSASVKQLEKKTEAKTLITITTNPTEKIDFKPVEYKFSKPLVLAENVKSIKAINNFKFSEPVNKKSPSPSESSDMDNFKSFTFTPAPAVLPLKKVVHKNNGENGPCAPAKELITTGSVMDILGKKNDLMDKFKPPEGTWECKVCMIRNVADAKKCVACETTKETNEQKSEGVKTADFGDKFKITSGQWECSICMIRNDSSKTKCAACETLKQTAPTPLKPVTDSDFGNKFKITTDKWECSTCMVRNENTKTACVACTNPRPGAKVTPSTGFGNAFKIPSSKWECSSCLVRNDNDKIKCIACETPKPGVNNLVNAGQKSSDWECSSCLVKNQESKLKCVCCETPKPGSTVVPKCDGAQFNFSVDKTQVNGHGFTFGIKPDINKEMSKECKSSAVLGDTVKTPTPAPASGFTFGVKPVGESKLPEVISATQIPPKFSFGVPSSASPKKRLADDSTEASVKKADISASGQSSAIPVNGDIKNEIPKSLSFGIPTVSTASSTMFSFGASTKTSTTTVPADKSVPSFNFNATTKPSQTNTTFTFGRNADSTTNKTTTTNTAPSFTSTTFSSSSANAFNTTPVKDKQTFAFNAPAKTESTTTPVFSFGAPSANQITSIPSFGAANKTESSNFPTGGFNTGNNNTTTTFNFTPANPSSGTFSFSANKTENTFDSTPPTFGAPSTANPVFGSPPSANTQAFGTPTINTSKFGVTPAAPTFGSPSAASQVTFGAQSSNTPSFGTPTPAAFGSTPVNFSSFGTPAQPVQNGMFNFGSSAASATPKTGFNFGASPAAPSGGFNFGASSNNTQNSGGFKFGAATSTPQFNADIKPSFNFTAGTAPNAFTAQPPESPKPTQRVIRRALRRTTQR